MIAPFFCDYIRTRLATAPTYLLCIPYSLDESIVFPVRNRSSVFGIGVSRISDYYSCPPMPFIG